MQHLILVHLGDTSASTSGNIKFIIHKLMEIVMRAMALIANMNSNDMNSINIFIREEKMLKMNR